MSRGLRKKILSGKSFRIATEKVPRQFGYFLGKTGENAMVLPNLQGKNPVL